jgi:hypothetical protein
MRTRSLLAGILVLLTTLVGTATAAADEPHQVRRFAYERVTVLVALEHIGYNRDTGGLVTYFHVVQNVRVRVRHETNERILLRDRGRGQVEATLMGREQAVLPEHVAAVPRPSPPAGGATR